MSRNKCCFSTFFTYLLPLPRNDRFSCAVNYNLSQLCMICTLIKCVRTHGRLYHNTEITVRITNRPTTNFGAECFEFFVRFKVLRQILQVHRLQVEQWPGFNPRHHGALAVDDTRALFSRST
jgi:hypothetical protein